MFSCNVVSRWAQLVSFLNCLQDVKLSRIAIYRDEFRRMNCSLNWSFIGCGELHCDSVKIRTMINPNLFFLRQYEFLDWNDCLVVLLLSATHFQRSGHARLIRGCFSFPQCFWEGVFSSLSPPPPRSLGLAPSPPSSLREVSTWRFQEQIARSKKTPTLQANSLRIYFQLSRLCFFWYDYGNFTCSFLDCKSSLAQDWSLRNIVLEAK